jgi:hypothetical protein
MYIACNILVQQDNREPTRMSFKVTHKYVHSVLNDENVVGFMADVFPNKLVREQVFNNIMDCVEPAGRHIFVHYGYGANGKTTFCNLLQTIFGDNKNIKIIHEINKRELIIAKRLYPIIFITCNSSDDITDVFEGDEWAYTTLIPHSEIFTKDEQKHGLSESFVEWIAPYIEAAKKNEEKDKIDMEKLIETAKNIGICMCDSDDEDDSDNESDVSCDESECTCDE